MPNKSILLNQLIRIELFNLKNICPLVYKSANTSFYTPLEKYSTEIAKSVVDLFDLVDPLDPTDPTDPTVPTDTNDLSI